MDYSYENLAFIVNNLEDISSNQIEIVCQKIKYGWPALHHFRKSQIYNEFKLNKRNSEILEEDFKEFEYGLMH